MSTGKSFPFNLRDHKIRISFPVVFLNFNNMAAARYMRFSNYDVYGFNGMGGETLTFKNANFLEFDKNKY
jgi:hypothetical protein